MSSSSLSSSGQHNSSQNDHQPPPSPKLRFQSNLAAVLNDPYKDRNKVPYLFTKTWGNDFTDSVHLSSINNIHPNYKNFKPNEFKAYLNEISDRQLKHSKNKLELIKSKNTSQKLLITRLNELEQIPKIFFDSNFSLSDKETFNSLISLKIFENSTGDNSTVVKSSNGLINASSSLKFEKNKLDQTESRKFILDKLGFYLDIIETQITNQITTKANTFFNAIHSQDEVQEHVLKTCTAVKGLRKNLNYLNERIVVASIKIIRLINLKIKYRAMLEKLELMSSIHQTKSTIELHLDSAEFTGALDLITMSQDILRQELRGIRSLRNFETQFNEADKTIDKSLHDEFVRYLISDLSRDFSLGSQLVNEEKLTSLILGILRLRSATFVDLCKDEILIYLKSTVKQTVVEYVSEFDEEALSQNEDESNLRLIDRIRKLKMPEFLHLLSKVLSNLKTMLSRAKTIIQFLIVIINAAAGVNSIKDNNSDEHENENQIVNRVILTKELINKTAHAKLVQNLTDLLSSSTDYAQERLVNLLDGKFKANELERLSTNDFVSLSNIIDEFILEFDQIANKKTSSLRSWLQNQANKFLHKFHNEKKDKITLALDSESWKQQNEVSSDFQNLVDHIIRNGLGTTRKYDSKSKGSSEVVMLFNEKYAIFGSVIVLVKIMDEYCQFTNDIPNLCYDAMTRLIEIFTIYNSKTYKMILGGGAFDQGILKLITFKTLVITYRSLELVLKFLPILKEFFKERLSEKQSITEKQFTKIIGDYEEHLVQLNSKLIFMMDEIFGESLSSYQVIAPVPSECFRSICNQINRVHAIVIDILAEPTLIRLFTDIHEKFKTRLKDRLKELNVVNDGGPKHALIFQDMTHYIKQFKNLNGLRTITINFLDVWES